MMKKYLTLFCLLLILSQQALFAQSLKITEVYVDGTDERLEITNTGPGDFTGPLSINGVKASTLSIASRTIPSLQSLIIGDNLAMITNIGSLTAITGQGLSMADTATINVTLSSNSTQLDSFSVPQNQVQSYDNTKTSFISLYTLGGQSRSTVPSITSYNQNNSGGFTINPGIVRTDQGLLSTPIISSTGTTTGSSNTGTSIDCQTMQSGRIDVAEIHRGSIYTPYIEIISRQSRQGSLTLSGDGLSQIINIASRSREANTRYLITATTSGLLHTSNIITIPGRSLNNTGIVSVWKDGNTAVTHLLLDSSGQTLSSSTSYLCLQGFDTSISPSPGFGEEFLGYAHIQTIVQTTTGSCTTTTGTTTTGGSNNNTGASTIYNRIVPGTVSISMIDYDPPGSDTNNERIGYILTGSTGLNLSGWIISYDGRTKTLGDTTLIPGQEYIATGNYTFVNSRPVCVSLLYQGIIIDTACYDPNEDSSPFIPGQGSGQILTGVSPTTTGLDDDNLDTLAFEIMNVVYDPPGSDTNNETVTIKMLAGSGTINLSSWRLRIGTRNKTIQGSISSGQTLTLIGNFQMSNSNATCVALVYDERIYDEYCYNPSTAVNNTPTNTETSKLYNNRTIHISDIVYDPEGSDEGRESFILSMTGNQETVDLTKLAIRINGGSKKKLSGSLYANTPLTMTGSRSFPNSRPTCIDLVENDHIFSTSCYDPLSGTTGLDILDTLSTGSVATGVKASLEDIYSYSGLHLAWIIPNPIGKDMKGSEQLGFVWDGKTTTIPNNKEVKVVVGKTSISLSGVVLSGQTVLFSSPKALTNKAACVQLMYYEKNKKARIEQDRFCYPKTKEGVIYYHPAYKKTTESFSLKTIKALSDDHIDLSALNLHKQGKNICLIYNKQTINCMAGGGSSQATQNKTKLANAYIRLASDLLKNNDINTLRSLTQDYQTLNKALNDKKSFLAVQGYQVGTTDLERYHALVSTINSQDRAREDLSRDLWGQEVVNNRYRILRNS